MRGGVIWMARARNPNRDKSKQIWLKSKGTKKLKDIAEELGCSASQIRKWKSQDKWEDELKGNAPIGNSNVTNEKERYQSAKGNQNAKDNPGNKRAKPPPNNKNAVTHGLFAKHLPKESLEIFTEVATMSPADILWQNIMIQYTAIIRAQKIMLVESKEDTTEWEKRRKGTWELSENGSQVFVPTEIEKEIQFSWDKQSSFLQSQSRAMATLNNMLRQFEMMSSEKDERRKRIDLMQAQIDKINGPKGGEDSVDWKQAIINAANKRAVKQDDE